MSNVIKIPRSLNKLLETCNTVSTKDNYVQRIEKFHEFIEIGLDELVKLDHKEIDDIVTDYILSIKHRYNPNSIPTMIAPVKAFLEMNDILINWKKLFRFFPDKVKVSGQSAWKTEDVQKMLNFSRKLSTRAMIHLLASTGCRAGGIVGLQIKHVTNMDHGYKMITVYAGDKEEYVTFLTPEASFAYDEHIKSRMDRGENVDAESYVFVQKNGRPVDRHAMYMVLKYVTVNANLRGDMVTGAVKGGRYRTQLCHGFRKRFNTVMKLNNEVNDNAIEKMMGHKNGLDGTYLQIPHEMLLENFMKGAIDLTVSDEHRLKLETIELQKEKQELEAQIQEAIKLQDEKIERLQRRVAEAKFTDDREGGKLD